MTTLQSYNQEVLPQIRSMLKKQEILKEFMAEDGEVLKRKAEIKELQESLKLYVEEKEAELTREIKDLATDIKLACQAAAKGTEFKAAQLRAYFTARAQDKVEGVFEKAELFTKLDEKINC